MKRLTGLVVITLFLLACSSAFGQDNLGFLSSDMSYQYCNYEQLEFIGGALAVGIDNNSACFSPDGQMLGFKVTLPPSNLPVTGTVYAMADSEFDAYCECWSGDQELFITGTQPYNIHAPHFGWELLFNTYDAFYAYLDNWGYLTSTLPLVAAKDDAKSKSQVRAVFQPLTYGQNAMAK
jgi:hypothetical protein